MPLVPIDAQTTAPARLSSLRAALAELPAGAPVIVMIHGFKFNPWQEGHCPHRHILSAEPEPGCRKAVSWPKHLGIGEGALGIAFGWQAAGNLWRAWAEAGRAGVALARVLELLAAEGRRAEIVGHSLGARVALAAIARAPAESVGRAILIAPAEFRDAAEAAMETAASRTAEIVNVTSRENDLFDALVEWLIAPHRPGARTLGHGLARPRSNWTNLEIGDPAVLAALARLGHRVAPSARRVCHWSGYLRPGLFPLYRAILSGALPPALLREALPLSPARRWSRLLELPVQVLPLRPKAPL
ncbi:MAG: alpha/beta hydrolase [Paracoccaceae bacterium]|nr:alpha/beta hydrolase [Paracoccaceae bacterium]